MIRALGLSCEKGFVNFHCRTVSLCKEFTVRIFECEVSTEILVPFLFR